MSNVIHLDVQTTCDVPVERVIEGAREADLAEIVIIGTDKDGRFFFAADKSSAQNILWLLECARHDLIERANG